MQKFTDRTQIRKDLIKESEQLVNKLNAQIQRIDNLLVQITINKLEESRKQIAEGFYNDNCCLSNSENFSEPSLIDNLQNDDFTLFEEIKSRGRIMYGSNNSLTKCERETLYR